jgi:tryptophanyl-tRNA synthetase
MPKIIVTGDRPTGPLHLGHFVGSLQNRVSLQNEKNTDGSYKYKSYILIADTQALTDNADRRDLIQDNVFNVTLDYLATGLDSKLSTIYIQSQIPELAELTLYFLNLLTVNQLERNPTVKEEIKQKGFENKLPVGFFIYPVSQAADIALFRGELVPVGADQIPMIEDTNQLVRKFNQTYNTDFLKECEALVPKDCGRLVGIDGKAKMSKTLENAIYLKDSNDELWHKVRQMYTDPNHLKVEDPGQVEGNVVFAYLDVFGSDQAEITKLKDHYRKGGLGDMKVKKYLYEVLEQVLSPIRKRREEFAEDPAQVWRILSEGTAKARENSSAAMSEIKRLMGLQYR